LSERDAKGQVRGVQRINAALRKNKVSVGKGITTSRDKGMAAVRRDLKRTGMPRGVEQWQEPIVVADGDFLFFTSRLKPNTKVPRHSHEGIDVVRVVIEGHLQIGDLVLGPGDSMLVLRGEEYAIQAGKDGCTVFYGHIRVPGPRPMPTPTPPTKAGVRRRTTR
jgi:redox-sensitive bicupin YhaK (pirin superfamily)